MGPDPNTHWIEDFDPFEAAADSRAGWFAFEPEEPGQQATRLPRLFDGVGDAWQLLVEAVADAGKGPEQGPVAELAALGRPAVLVPYPYATADHQRKNAEWMVKAGAALMVADAELDGPWSKGWQFALSGPIYAGTNEIQRNIIAERVNRNSDCSRPRL